MRDLTDAGIAWLVSSRGAASHEAAQWTAAPRSRRELPAGIVFDVVGVEVGWTCGLLDRFVEYGLHGVPIAVVDGMLYVLVRPGSAEQVRGLTINDQSDHPVAVTLLGRGDRFIAPPLERGTDEQALWLVVPSGAPHLPLASLVLGALGSLPNSANELSDISRRLRDAQLERGQKDAE